MGQAVRIQIEKISNGYLFTETTDNVEGKTGCFVIPIGRHCCREAKYIIRNSRKKDGNHSPKKNNTIWK